MQTFNNVDSLTNREFQKRFNHFYRIRQRTPEFYTVFYQKLEVSKKGNHIKCTYCGHTIYANDVFEKVKALLE